MSTTTTATKITYRKTKSGEWVAYGPADAIRAGHTVTVTKRSGETKTEKIARVGRPFQVDGIEMVYGYIEQTRRHVRTPASRCKSGTGDCWSFGVRGCWECGS